MSTTGFFGSTISQRYYFPDSGSVWPGNNLSPAPYVVTSGVENINDFFTVDVSDTAIVMTFTINSSWTGSSFNGPMFSDLLDNVPEIIGVTIDTDMSGLDMSDLNWDANNISINWAGLYFGPYYGTTHVTINVTFQPLNVAPEVTGVVTSISTEDDAPYSIDLLAGASDGDGDTLSVSGLTLDGGDASGVTVNGNSLDIDPNAYNALAAGESAVIDYSYMIEDGNGGSVAQTAQITINGVNDGPTANDDDLSGSAGGSNVLLVGTEMNATTQAYLASAGFTSTIIGGGDLESTDLTAYDSIWVSWLTFVTDTGGTLAAKLAAFVAGGGNLLVEPLSNVIGYLPNGADISESGGGGQDVVIVDLTSDLGDGLTSADLSDWGISYHEGWVLSDYDQFKLFAENSSGLDLILTQKYGFGNIVVTAQDPSYHLLYGNWHGGDPLAGPQLKFIVNALTMESGGPLTDEDTAVVIDGADLLANDTDPDATDVLSISGVSTLSLLGATMTLNGDGTITYDPSGALDYLAEGEVVTDYFTYTISDGNGGSDEATVSLKVVGINDGPSAPVDVDGPSGASISEHLAVGSAIGLHADSTDPEGDPITYYFKDGTNTPVQTLGKFTIDASTGVVTLAGAVNYELQAGYTLTIFASDGSLESSSDFTVTIENVVEHLFTPGNDVVDFNALPPGAYDLDGAEYDALAGDDFVWLPNMATSALPGHAWDYGRTFSASAGNDMVQGGDGNDIVSGGSGNDRLFGGLGDDRLVGAEGNDIIGGGDGSDKLTGSSGRDIFVFTDSEVPTSRTGEHDTITDFKQGEDRLDLSALYDTAPYFGGIRSGTPTQAATASGYKAYFFSENGKTWVMGDTNGVAGADFAIELSGSYKLKGTDLIVGDSFISSVSQWNTATAGLNWAQHHSDYYMV